MNSAHPLSPAAPYFGQRSSARLVTSTAATAAQPALPTAMNTIAPEYIGDAEVIDAGEFARLIRKNRGLKVYLHACTPDYASHRSVPGVLGCMSFKLSVKKALADLADGSLDAFSWQFTANIGPHLDHAAAPELLQLRRALPRLRAKIEDYERLAASYTHPDAASYARRCHDYAATTRRQLAEVQDRLAALNAQPAAHAA